MVDNTADVTRLAAFYGAMSSLDGIMAALTAAGVDTSRPRARDLYCRDLDCHNLGMHEMHEMLEVLVGVAGEYGTLGSGDTVLDVGCGMGGPGRFLVDRFECSVVGIDLLALRIEIAQALSDLTGHSGRITYQVADATALPVEDRSVDEVWLLDVALHIRDKRTLFAEIARVLRPGGLLVMHDQMAPIPKSMRPVTRQAPYLALALPRLIRIIEDAGLRILTWRDTTERVLAHFGKVRARLTEPAGPPSEAVRPSLQHALGIVDGYIDALADLGSSTGILVARGGLDVPPARRGRRGSMTGVEIVNVVDEGLGHSGHVVGIDGEVLVIDPLRRTDRYEQVVERRGWRIAWTADTHTHADYASGSHDLARRGAVFLAPRDARLAAPHRPIDGDDEIELGRLTLRALPTPGHTPDHLAYLLLEGAQPIAVFTGGSLMVGTVGRPDLFGPEHADRLARAMWRSLHEQLLVLPDDLPVYPTHGAGSFCSVPGAAERTTTIGSEKATNPLLQFDDEDSFVRALIGGLGPLPTHFTWLPERNRHGFGPPVIALAALAPETVAQLASEGAEVVDVRPVAAFAAGHVPGSLSNALRPVFGTWLGALVPPDRVMVFVTDDSTDRDELLRQCANVGHDRIGGELAEGTAAWVASRRPLTTIPVVAAEALEGPVLDVRQTAEYGAGHLPGAGHVELGALVEVAADLDGPIAVMCGHGERAATGASLLSRHGASGVRIVTGGPADWAAANQQTLEVTGV